MFKLIKEVKTKKLLSIVGKMGMLFAFRIRIMEIKVIFSIAGSKNSGKEKEVLLLESLRPDRMRK